MTIKKVKSKYIKNVVSIPQSIIYKLPLNKRLKYSDVLDIDFDVKDPFYNDMIEEINDKRKLNN